MAFQRDSQLLECFNHQLISFLIKLGNHLLPEVKVLRALLSFMVPSEHIYHIWKSYFQGKKVGYNFRTIHTSINIITEEKEFLVTFAKFLLP